MLLFGGSGSRRASRQSQSSVLVQDSPKENKAPLQFNRLVNPRSEGMTHPPCFLLTRAILPITRHAAAASPPGALITENWLLPVLHRVGRPGTSLGRLWDGSKPANDPMFTGLGTLGRLREGVEVGASGNKDDTRQRAPIVINGYQLPT